MVESHTSGQKVSIQEPQNTGLQEVQVTILGAVALNTPPNLLSIKGRCELSLTLGSLVISSPSGLYKTAA